LGREIAQYREREIEMNSNLVASALRKEKELLEKILELAQCQPELSESGRAEDLEVLLSLRADSLAELANAEQDIDVEMDWDGDPAAATEDLEQLNELNLAVLELANRIVTLDEKTEWLAEQHDDCAATAAKGKA
jgi:hypothetical protein